MAHTLSRSRQLTRPWPLILRVAGAGLLLTPPDTRSNTQRIYVPRQSIQSLEVVSLIGAAKKRAQAEEQPELFQGRDE